MYNLRHERDIGRTDLTKGTYSTSNVGWAKVQKCTVTVKRCLYYK